MVCSGLQIRDEGFANIVQMLLYDVVDLAHVDAAGLLEQLLLALALHRPHVHLRGLGGLIAVGPPNDLIWHLKFGLA